MNYFFHYNMIFLFEIEKYRKQGSFYTFFEI